MCARVRSFFLFCEKQTCPCVRESACPCALLCVRVHVYACVRVHVCMCVRSRVRLCVHPCLVSEGIGVSFDTVTNSGATPKAFDISAPNKALYAV